LLTLYRHGIERYIVFHCVWFAWSTSTSIDGERLTQGWEVFELPGFSSLLSPQITQLAGAHSNL